jgi:hypothetical protein
VIRRCQYRIQPIWSDHLRELIWSWIPSITKDGGAEWPEQLG